MPGPAWFKEHFDVEGDVLTYFHCALKENILLQGRIYLTATHVCFHSVFNDQTLLGQETKLRIAYEELSHLSK